MERYNYREAIMRDIRYYIEENINLDEWMENREGLEEELNDSLWMEDSVTGNCSGSYTFNRWKAEENICHNFDLYEEALQEFGGEPEFDAERIDVTIRCYLLGECISEVLDEMESNGDFDSEGDGE